MDSGAGDESDSPELQHIVDTLEEQAREAHEAVREELPGAADVANVGELADGANVGELRESIDTTRQYLRKLEQYVVALEEQAGEE